MLFKALALSVSAGTAEFPAWVRECFPDEDQPLRLIITKGLFSGVVHCLKQECLRNAIPLSDAVLTELSFDRVRWNRPLPVADRLRLMPLADELLAHWYRRHPASLPVSAQAEPPRSVDLLPQLASQRITCEPADRSVHIDGKLVEGGMGEAEFVYFRMIAEHYPASITFREMKKRSSSLSKKNESRFRKGFCRKHPRLAAMIEAVPGEGTSLSLPPR